MVGIVVDSGRMHVTKKDWIELLQISSKVTGRHITELHTADFYHGNDVWRGLKGSIRANVISEIFNWLADRKHHIVYSSVLKEAYFMAKEAGELPRELHTIWRFLGFHLTLAIQRYSQPEKRNKGNTFLVFDNEERERVRFNDIIKTPPAWSDAYYGRGTKQQQLDQIIDVPAFQDSKDVGLLQLADFVAFFLRRYAEIQEGLVPAKYKDEADRIEDWIKQASDRSIGVAHIYPRRQRNEAQEIFYRHAPKCIRDL